MKPVTLIFVCNPWDSYIESMIAQGEEQYAEHEREEGLFEDSTLHAREPELFAMRELDPHWPPREVAPFEETDVEVVDLWSLE